ncbi:MAG: cation transporter [Thermomicrobiales bacterium]|nr:cation transporter [Thermomicrobiales bacterium]
MTDTIQLKAPDISCGHCVASVKSRVGGIEGVETVDASAETKLVDITFDISKVSLEKIQAELADEGYPATPV